MRLSTKQHGLYNKQKEDTLITEHFVKGMPKSSSGVAHHLVPRFRVQDICALLSLLSPFPQKQHITLHVNKAKSAD